MSTVLEDFSEGVTASVIGVPKDALKNGIVTGKPVAGIDIISIMALIEAIMAAISGLMDNCPQNDVALREAIKKPTLWQRVRAGNYIRRRVEDCCGTRWGRRTSNVVSEVLAQAAASSDETIDQAIDQVRNSSF